tara:strand:+ start:258 stop:650 length:393 start_codon:yes stop_codon:yes gene_type:complete
MCKFLFISLIALSLSSCAKFSNSEFEKMSGSSGAKESNLTAGMISLKIKKGETLQSDILEVFGPPDQTTHKGNMKVWTYDKISYSVRSDAGGLGFYSASSTRSQSVSTLLILYFNESDIVVDYRFDSYKF